MVDNGGKQVRIDRAVYMSYFFYYSCQFFIPGFQIVCFNCAILKDPYAVHCPHFYFKAQCFH